MCALPLYSISLVSAGRLRLRLVNVFRAILCRLMITCVRYIFEDSLVRFANGMISNTIIKVVPLKTHIHMATSALYGNNVYV